MSDRCNIHDAARFCQAALRRDGGLRRVAAQTSLHRTPALECGK
ncbi:MAG TPA: hypothetical protein VF666_18845 [Pyrinomonadaceae bacterium]